MLKSVRSNGCVFLRRASCCFATCGCELYSTLYATRRLRTYLAERALLAAGVERETGQREGEPGHRAVQKQTRAAPKYVALHLSFLHAQCQTRTRTAQQIFSSQSASQISRRPVRTVCAETVAEHFSQRRLRFVLRLPHPQTRKKTPKAAGARRRSA